MGMTMPEALVHFPLSFPSLSSGLSSIVLQVAATINAAASLGVSDRCGSLEVGKFGDCVVVDAPSWEHIIYQLIDSPIANVIKKGQVIV